MTAGSFVVHPAMMVYSISIEIPELGPFDFYFSRYRATSDCPRSPFGFEEAFKKEEAFKEEEVFKEGRGI